MSEIKGNIVVLSSHTPSLFWFRTDMMSEFLNRGYNVYALGNEAEADWASRFLEKGILYEQIQVCRNGVNPFHDKKTLHSIKEKLRKINPVKIFTYQAKTIIYGTLAANSLGITEVYPLIAGIGSVFITDSFKSRVIRIIMTFLYRKSMKKCPLVFFQNKDDEIIFRNNRIITNQDVKLLHGSGVNLEKFTLLPLPEKTAFLCISRLIKDKGVSEYLEACKLLKKDYPQVRCLLVGPFDSNPSALKPEDIEPYINNDIIEFFGEQEEVRPLIKQASVFVLPSYREGTPKTNLEAMACGRPIITTDTTGCRETVVDGENGFLVRVKDVNHIYQKMKFFVDNPEIIARMGQCGRKMTEEIFDVNKVNEEICKSMRI